MNFAAEVRQENAGMKQKDIAKMAGKNWQKLTPEQKAKYAKAN